MDAQVRERVLMAADIRHRPASPSVATPLAEAELTAAPTEPWVRHRILAIAGVVRRAPYPGQHYKHGWIPTAGGIAAGGLDLEEKARARHTEIQAKRPIAAAVTEALGLAFDEVGQDVARRRIAAVAKAAGLDDAIRDELLAEVGQPDRLRDTARRIAKDAGLNLIAEPGEVVPFDRKQHELFETDDHPQVGENVGVDVAGYTATMPDGETVLLSKAKVSTYDPAIHGSGQVPRDRSLLWADSEARAWDPSKHPRGPDGKFLHLGPRLVEAVDNWIKAGQKGDPLHDWSRPQLVSVAKKRGMLPPKSTVELKRLLIADAKMQLNEGPKPDKPSAPPASAITLSPPTGKFELPHDTGLSGDGYAPGGQWGKYGAAGVLIRHSGGGEPRYLLVQRGPGVSSNKGKWQLPGGALNEHENAYQGAARETVEEVGAPESFVDSLTPVGEHVYTHEPTGWSYTTIAADSPAMFDPQVDGTETGDARWFTADEIDTMREQGQLVPKLDTAITPIIAAYPKPPAKAVKKTAPKKTEPLELGDIFDMNDAVPAGTFLAVAQGDDGQLYLAVSSKASGPKIEVVIADSDGNELGSDLVDGAGLGDEFGHLDWYTPHTAPASVKKAADKYWPGVTNKPLPQPEPPKTARPGPPTAAKLVTVKIPSAPGTEVHELTSDGTHIGTIVHTDVGWTALPPGGKPGKGKAYESKAAAVSALAKAHDAAKPIGPAKKVPVSQAGVTGVTVTPISPATGLMSWQNAKRSEQVHLDGEHIGTIHQYGYGWSAETADGDLLAVPASATKSTVIKELLARHEYDLKLKANAQKAADEAAARQKIRDQNAEILHGTPANPSEAEQRIRSGDFSELKRVGGALGSNEGGVYEAPDGSRWYVKAQKSKAHADNETLAAAFYRQAGIHIPEVIRGAGAPELSGEHHTATRMLTDVRSDLKDRIKNAAKGKARDRSYVRAAHEGFAVDVWLANWDVAGLNFDNIVSAGGRPARIDAGGSLLYRAQGGEKGSAFGPQVLEWDTFTDPESTFSSAALFDTITSEEIVRSAERVKAITPAKIRQMVKAHGLPPSLADTLIERRKDLLSRAKLEAKKPPKPYAEGALVEEAALHAVPVSMHDTVKVLTELGVSQESAVAARDALNNYKGIGYININKHLRGVIKGDQALQDRIRDIDLAFEHSGLNTDIVVWRGEHDPSRYFPAGEWSPTGGMEGKEWTFPSYTSTSADETTAAFQFSGKGHTLFQIVVPKGTAAIALDSYYGGESEVLLDRGLRYRVVKDHGVVDGIRRIDLAVVA